MSDLRLVKSAGIFAVIYGPSKTGKSTATGAAGAAGLFLAQPGGLLPLTKFLGLPQAKYLCPTDIQDAATLITAEGPKYSSVVVDDFSLLVEQTIKNLETKYSFGEMWRQLRHQVLSIRDAARKLTESGVHVFFNCHESSPKTSSGKYVRGGPMLPGQLPEQFSAFADVVARVKFDETAAPWRYTLRTGPDAEYISGDRLDIFPDPAPMNLREAFLEAGYTLPRPKGMEWMDKAVEKICAVILKNGIDSWRETLKGAATPLQKEHPLPVVRWVLQDSLHRAIIRNSRKNLLDDLFTEPQESSW